MRVWILLAAFASGACRGSESSPDVLPSIHDACRNWDPRDMADSFFFFQVDVDNGYLLEDACAAAFRFCDRRIEPDCGECRLALVAQVYGAACDTGSDLNLGDWFEAAPQVELPEIAGSCEEWSRLEQSLWFSERAIALEAGLGVQDACALAYSSCVSQPQANCVACKLAIIAQLYGQECGSPVEGS
jgi:hypothetical protein